ncbi:hypothetical protein ACC806_38260, partial [Rhizobium ruizarguesonis]
IISTTPAGAIHPLLSPPSSKPFATGIGNQHSCREALPEDDIAPVVLFLASKDSQFIKGYSLTPDGGAIIDSAR